ncbi:unnamed protein product, partial [Iphiclides podalirius]
MRHQLENISMSSQNTEGSLDVDDHVMYAWTPRDGFSTISHCQYNGEWPSETHRPNESRQHGYHLTLVSSEEMVLPWAYRQNGTTQIARLTGGIISITRSSHRGRWGRLVPTLRLN